ncbi:methyl-accepting chemotaxis protein [Solibacillus sp. FSL K6-1554]|uniref:methyl-accepting chemotaxis protein n=1 Tax=Solibacillus sp. FSL K6-1554 TaxID=2921472 RepID=UPI0030F7E6E6
MRFRNAIKFKDRLAVLMIICICSNIILTVFSMDYLRKMEREAQALYEEKLMTLHMMQDIEQQYLQTNEILAQSTEQLTAAAFDSKMEFYMKQLASDPSAALFEEIDAYIIERASAQLTNHENDIKFGYSLLLSISIILMALILFFGIQAIRSINKPTRELKQLFKLVQHGDLTKYATYSARDELGETTKYYNLMIADMKELLKTVRKNTESATEANNELQTNAEQITTGAVRIAASSDDMRGSLQYATARLSDNAASVQQVAAGIDEITERMHHVDHYIKETIAQAVDGEAIVGQNIVQMQDVEQAMQTASNTIIELNEQTQHVSRAVTMIHSIADQTNLLALNASIEAARAGEHGQGFAVVAQEVRKLAEQSQEFTKSIATIVTKIQQGTLEATTNMENAMRSVDTGVTTTQLSAAKFREITMQVQQISPQMEHVSTIMNEISDHTHDVAHSSIELSNRSEENLVSMHLIQEQIDMQKKSTAEIYEEIQSIAKNMRSLTHAVKRFQI